MNRWKKIIASATVAGLLLALGAEGPADAKPKQPCNPCNPCNPCGGKQKIKPLREASQKQKSSKDLVMLGEKLWKDRNLGKAGLSCDTCHADYNTFKGSATQPYPHRVEMADDILTLDQMINFCMENPMATKPLPWNSAELSALNAYYTEWINGYKAPANPCGMKNPCNPCNPCAKKKMKNPCNPCNPCGKKK